MHLSLFDIHKKTVVSWYAFVVAVNLVLGLLLWSIHYTDHSLAWHLTVAQVSRLTIATCVLSALYVFDPKNIWMRFALLVAAIIVGAVIGALANAALFAPRLGSVIYFNILFGTLIGTIIFGSAFFWESLAINRANLEKAQLKRLDLEKRSTEARLKTLHAQIEPHFLFNTLSNILSLFDTDIEKGKSMQKDLILYLESSLSKIRTELSTIGEEINLVIAYLNIFKVRLEERLQYRTDIPDHLTNIAFPPMLIQPLVENAIKHGIEPKVDGGEIRISAKSGNENVYISVADTGLGMSMEKGARTGLENVRQRLRLQYGEKGRLTITENQPTGIKAIIEIPYAST